MTNNIQWTRVNNPYKDNDLFEQDQHEVRWMTKRNQDRLGIRYLKQVKRVKVKSKITERKRMEFPDGWFVNYTDNAGMYDKFETDYTLVTVHGLPGRPEDFYYLEKELNGYCRVIGYCIPGFDDETEIRGNYRGTRLNNAEMINRLLGRLNIDKIFIVMHSGGGSVGSMFTQTFPKKVMGVLKLCTFG